MTHSEKVITSWIIVAVLAICGVVVYGELMLRSQDNPSRPLPAEVGK